MANEKGVWRTIGGRRIFIKEGQDLASAMKESGKFNSSSNSKAKKGDSVLEEFKKSDGNTKSFEKALNKISEMEYNNEINPDEYKEYISKIQKEYVEKNKKTNNDDYEYNLYKQAKENPDSINSMTEMSTDWEDLDKRFKDRYEKENQKSDLMTAEQLKGKDREEQKEINKQYLKEQNKLAKEKNDANFAKEWYEGTKKTENMAKENLERAKRNGASVEDLSNRTRQVHELELETQKAQEHANKMSAKTNASNENKTANYSQKELNDVYKKEDYTEVISNLKQSEINKMNEAAFDMNTTTPGTPGYNNAKEFIQKMENKAAAQFLDKQNKVNSGNDVMNNNIRNAYQEYKKKHPGSKINFSKFKDNYKS